MPAGNRILAVDDNPANLAIVEEIFQGRFNLRLAHDGSEALRIAPTFLPDVVLLDVMMPKPDGFEVCSRMKNDPTLRHSQIILVSARTDIEDRLRGYKAGADDYVTKPFEEEELCAKVCANLRTKSIYGTIRDQVGALCDATGDVLELVAHLRDAETGEHLDRMRIYAQLLAAELRQTTCGDQIDDAFLDYLYRASPLHDIGKIVIPDAILRKPAALTDDERAQMQQHPVLGEQILNRLAARGPDASYFPMAAQIARWHHECVDGSGYPDGLSGNAIPLAARIVKVADAFDAITSARVYKSARSVTEAHDEIVAGKGQAYCPIVVDALTSVLDDFREVAESAGIAEEASTNPPDNV
jgi:cyclic di-GMP phosphodiesterase